jgi:uncharacterized membrane protein
MSEKLFSTSEREAIIKAIRNAEIATSGEIQVHIESRCKSEVIDRAMVIFDKLKMYQTEDRNGVLFYLAVEDKKFAILGDSGINEAVPVDFWETIKEHLASKFKAGQFTEGLIEGIQEAGKQLGSHFPNTGDSDINELPDEISFGS